MSSTAVASLVQPWIGVIGAYVIVILRPQAVWWWNFSDLRPALFILLPTLLGFGIAFLRGQLNLATIKNNRSVFVVILWFFITVSYFIGPYVDMGGPNRVTDPGWAFSTYNKIFLLYFVACICIDKLHKLQILAYVIIVAALILTYWANSRYLSGQVYGRMAGPTTLSGTGSYADQNNFAMFFVVALPFLWYYGASLKNNVAKYALWLTIPFGWHAIFLTGSRGALVGVAVTLAVTVWRARNKMLGILIIPAFIVAFVWQAGDIMWERAGTISQYETETSASGRLEAWGAAVSMIAGEPITGVGIASFGVAFPDFSDAKSREAHNTFFQIAGESGLIAGLMYLLVVFSCFLALWRNGKEMVKVKNATEDEDPLYWINEATLVGFTGLIACSLFLSLQLFEIFYYFAVIINALIFLNKKEGAHAEENLLYRGRRRMSAHAPAKRREHP